MWMDKTGCVCKGNEHKTKRLYSRRKAYINTGFLPSHSQDHVADNLSLKEDRISGDLATSGHHMKNLCNLLISG